MDDFIISFLAEACNVERSAVHPDTDLTQIGFDSLSAASLTYLVEAQFGCELGEDDVVRLYDSACVADVIALVKQVVAARKGANVRGDSSTEGATTSES